MTKHKSTFSLSFFFLTAFLCAQQAGVEGTVIDPSGRRVRGAEVQCAGRTATTSLDGAFRFPEARDCDATVAAPGFRTETARLVAGDPARIELKLAGVTERIVVSAIRAEVPVEETGVAANVVTGSELAERGFPWAVDVLREIPGMEVTRSGRDGSLTSLFTRGAPSNATLVLVDGMPVNDPGGSINFGNWGSGAVGRIEVVRAPQSVLFGAEASAGVVQMFTRRGEAEDKRPHGEFSYERGSFQTDRWTAGLSGGSGERLDYSLSAGQFHTVGEFQNDFYRNSAGSVNLGYRFSGSTQLRGIFRSFDSSLGVPGQVRYGLVDTDAYETDRDTLVSLRLDDARGRRYLQSVFFGYHRADDVTTDLTMNGPYTVALLLRDVYAPVHRVYREAILDPNHLPAAIPAGTRIFETTTYLYPGDAPYVTLNSRARFEYQGTLAQKNGALVVGYTYERQDGEISTRDVGRNKNGVFAMEQYSIGRRVFLTGGLRAENSSVFGTEVAPRGAASFLLAGEKGAHSSTFFRVSAGRGITEPSLVQNFSRETWYVGNPNLKTEKTRSYEAGLVQEWFGRRLHAEVAAFWNSFRDLIVFVSLPPPTWGSWDNVDASWARGFEFSARFRLTKNIMLNGACTRLYTRIVNSNQPDSLTTGIGQELLRRPRNSGAMSVAITPRRWWLLAGATMVGERQDTDFLGTTRNYAYQNVYLSGGYRVNRYVTPFLRADNLLNSRYEEALGYSSLSRSIRGGLKLAW